MIKNKPAVKKDPVKKVNLPELVINHATVVFKEKPVVKNNNPPVQRGRRYIIQPKKNVNLEGDIIKKVLEESVKDTPILSLCSADGHGVLCDNMSIKTLECGHSVCNFHAAYCMLCIHRLDRATRIIQRAYKKHRFRKRLKDKKRNNAEIEAHKQKIALTITNARNKFLDKLEKKIK
jgi:hypothetical protein